MYAEAHGIPIEFMTSETFTRARQTPFDIAVVASFGQLIPKSVIERFPYPGINMHPSLLPKYVDCSIG
jgi:methionyl-tRNA formyltransferase